MACLSPDTGERTRHAHFRIEANKLYAIQYLAIDYSPRMSSTRTSHTRTNMRTSTRSAITSLQLDGQLCFALYSTSLALTRQYKPLLEPLGLTYPQYLALLVLWERDALSVNELGQRLFLDSGTLTPLLKRMEAAGWLTRTRAVDDERRVIVALTPAAQALRKQAQLVSRQLAKSTGCSANELLDLTRRVQQLRSHLQADASAH